STEQRRDLARWHRDLYPGPEWLLPLQPDTLAEELVTQVLQDCPELSRSGFRELPPAQALRALTGLDRATLVRPGLEAALMEVLASDLEGLAPSAISVAIQTGDPIGRLLAQVLDGQDDVPLALLGLVEQLPQQTVSLREVAALLTAARVDLAQTNEPPE